VGEQLPQVEEQDIAIVTVAAMRANSVATISSTLVAR
jgi:hypothetical protein